MSFIRIALFFFKASALLFFFCMASIQAETDRSSSTKRDRQVVNSPNSTYTPALCSRGDYFDALAKNSPPGNWKHDYSQAASSSMLGEAEKNWEKLFKNAEVDGELELEDGFQAHHFTTAEFERMRVYYLLGKIEKGDKLLLQLAKNFLKQMHPEEEKTLISISKKPIPPCSRKLDWYQPAFVLIDNSEYLKIPKWRTVYLKASETTSLSQAKEAWQNMLTISNGGITDAIHGDYVDIALFELMRVHYLLKETPEDDLLLRHLHDRLQDFETGKSLHPLSTDLPLPASGKMR